MHSAPVLIMEHARHEQRWPRFIPEGVKKGLRAQLALRLFTEGQTLGSINMYSTSADRIDPAALAMAELFATYAAIALGRARHEHQLNLALESRRIIGQVTGLVLGHYQVDEDRAFHFPGPGLASSNIKVRDVAQEVIDNANDKFRITKRD